VEETTMDQQNYKSTIIYKIIKIIKLQYKIFMY